MAKQKDRIYATPTQRTSQHDKEVAIEIAQNQLASEYGEKKIFRLSEQPKMDVEVVSSGSLALDKALGIGGYPRGRIVEIFGPESSGKTTLALHAIAEAQKKGGYAAIIDAEHAFDRSYAEALGCDMNRLFISQPDNGEQALDIADTLISSGAIDVLVIDSVAALTPRDEIEGDMGDRNMGLQARLMSQAMRKLTSNISTTNTCCIFINQLRDKIGILFGDPETTTGGKALRFYASVRLEIRSGNAVKEKDQTIGRVARCRVVKNKMAPPFQRAEFDMIFGEGISRAGEVLDMSVENGIIQKSGAWFSYNGNKLGQGRDTVRKIISDNPELLEELAGKLRAIMYADTGLPESNLQEQADKEEAPAEEPKKAKKGKAAKTRTSKKDEEPQPAPKSADNNEAPSFNGDEQPRSDGELPLDLTEDISE